MLMLLHFCCCLFVCLFVSVCFDCSVVVVLFFFLFFFRFVVLVCVFVCVVVGCVFCCCFCCFWGEGLFFAVVVVCLFCCCLFVYLCVFRGGGGGVLFWFSVRGQIHSLISYAQRSTVLRMVHRSCFIQPVSG